MAKVPLILIRDPRGILSSGHKPYLKGMEDLGCVRGTSGESTISSIWKHAEQSSRNYCDVTEPIYF